MNSHKRRLDRLEQALKPPPEQVVRAEMVDFVSGAGTVQQQAEIVYCGGQPLVIIPVGWWQLI